MVPEELNPLSNTVIGACIEVHRHLGPGLLESAYEECVFHELRAQGLACERQVPVPIVYKGFALPNPYRLDLRIEGKIILELKAVDALLPVHFAQAITYLRLTNAPLALVVNFHAATLRGQIRRFVNRAPELSPPRPRESEP
jgi:GxxExxY protein